MDNDLIYVFAEGFRFLGKRVLNGLQKASIVTTVNIMTPQGPGSMQTIQHIGNLEMPGNYPWVAFNPAVDKDIYREYVRLTTGIEVPSVN